MEKRIIKYETVAATVEALCIDSCYELPDDVLEAITKAAKIETDERAKNILGQLIDNAELARQQRIPLCQDTGLTVVFVEQGADLIIAADGGLCITDAINAGVANGYENGLLRKSIVAEPLNERVNTASNTPAVIHYSIVPGDKLKITVMAKGGGCENKSQFKMFNPTDSKQTVSDWIVDVVRQAGANACPPFVIGVGLGGNFETSCLISKKALLRNIDDHNPEPFYAEMESELLEKINELNVGPQGFGGKTTALAVKIETAACHIASLPAAVNIECHSHRHKSQTL